MITYIHWLKLKQVPLICDSPFCGSKHADALPKTLGPRAWHDSQVPSNGDCGWVVFAAYQLSLIHALQQRVSYACTQRHHPKGRLSKEEWIDRFSSWTVFCRQQGQQRECQRSIKRVTIQTIKLFSQTLTAATSKQKRRTLFYRETFLLCQRAK